MSDKALLEASAGATGALFSMGCLYPLDLAKTRIQAAGGDAPPSLAAQLARLVKEKGPIGLFRGLEAKALHTLVSAFAFFYVSSFVKSAYVARRGRPGTGANLALECAAACVNVSMTLPLDVVVTRVQTGGGKGGVAGVVRAVLGESGWRGLWRGYGPSLLLSTNPAITFTAFDRLKGILLRRKGAAASLSALEAFVVGALAKTLATLLTYPLIRAKVVLMAQAKSAAAAPGGEGGERVERPYAGMRDFLVRVGGRDGAAGLYQGCSAQLLNTVLKSALLLMTKERVQHYTVQMLVRMGVGKSSA